jgi:hypothetical protein
MKIWGVRTFRRIPDPDAAVVLAKDHIEQPMAGILSPPIWFIIGSFPLTNIHKILSRHFAAPAIFDDRMAGPDWHTIGRLHLQDSS